MTKADPLHTSLTEHAGIEVPLICGAMYPCSNPELVAAASEAGGLGVIQPISMEFVHKRKLRDGIRYMRTLTKKPIGFNAIVEKSSKVYEDRMRAWVDIAIEEGIRFFVTALGNPRWVVEKAHAVGGVVYHDITNLKWAKKALEHNVDGLICVNSRAGGHAGQTRPEELFEELKGLGVPLICAGGIGDAADFQRALEIGYAGVQMGTRFIATSECNAHQDYKQAICAAKEQDIVLTEKISGVPVAVIETPYIKKVGTKAGFVMKRMLRHRKLKHYARMFYSVKAIFQLKKANLKGATYKDYFQAGKSVEGVDEVESVATIIHSFRDAVALPAETKAEEPASVA
ncbi:MAG: NAD(P)H-dependent flavin oxidoreductase [Planctomycetota bacterium]